MKLFQKLLLAPAALGLLAPLAANASEANYRDVTSYSQNGVEVTLDTFKPLTNKNPLYAGGEGIGSSDISDFDGDTFSSTTTAAFSSNWAFGSLDGTSDTTTKFVFDYGIELTTSFTGNDSLDVAMEAGNASLLTELDLTSNANKLNIDTISYTTSLGEKLTLYMGQGNTSGSALYNTACVYGGVTNTLDDCGVASVNLDENFGSAFGASFDLGRGITVSLGYEGEGQSVGGGLLSDEGPDAFGGQIAYINDTVGVSLGFSNIENHNSSNGIGPSNSGVTTGTAVNAFYSPDIANLPSISVGFETTHDDSAASTADEASHYFVGVQWDEFGDGTLGAAIGSKAPYLENADAETMYEVFYSYNYADGITLTPLLYVKENATAGTADETGLILKTSFNF